MSNDFDYTRFYLGKLCPQKHGYRGGNQSLRHKTNWCCVECMIQRAHLLKSQKPKKTLEQVLWARVDNTQECWEWQGCKDKKGYGQLRFNGTTYRTHRLALVLSKGEPSSKDLLACHFCDNPSCCRPDHLFWGTPKENTQDMMNKNRHRCNALAGESVWNSKFTAESIQEIRFLWKSGVKQSEIAKRFNTTQGHVNNIIKRRAWSHVN